MYLFQKILRIIALVSCLSLVFFFLLDGCGGMSGSDEDDFRDRDRGRGDRGRDSFRDRGEDRPEEEEERGGGFRERFNERGLPSSDSEDESISTERESLLLEPLEQTTASEKIDFLFIVDTSPSSRKYIKKAVIKQKLGSFIYKLNEEGIDWRILTTCGHTNDKEPLYNGRLHEMEHRGSLIKFLYLENDVLNSYNVQNQTAFNSEVFIDTISHDAGQRGFCKLPPFCYKDKENRPLKALGGFLDISHHVLRKDADLIVVVISNQDERPSQKKPKQPYSPRKIIDKFEQKFSNKNLFVINFVLKSTDTNCVDRRGKTASLIPQLAILTSGLTESICSKFYTQTIIDFIREKQGKEVMNPRRRTPVESESPANLRSYLYGDDLELR